MCPYARSTRAEPPCTRCLQRQPLSPVPEGSALGLVDGLSDLAGGDYADAPRVCERVLHYILGGFPQCRDGSTSWVDPVPALPHR